MPIICDSREKEKFGFSTSSNNPKIKYVQSSSCPGLTDEERAANWMESIVKVEKE